MILDEGITITEATVAGADARQVSVIGGTELCALALHRAGRLELTEIDADPAGDTHFPPFGRLRFAGLSRKTQVPADATPSASDPSTRQAGTG